MDTPKQPVETKKKPETPAAEQAGSQPVPEVGGRGGADPVRYGDWEIKGRCVDF
jgi:hypothetical protein